MDIEKQIKKFNKDNLTSAIETCYEKPSYRVLIVVPERVKLIGSIVINRVRKLYPRESSEFKIRRDLIAFPNGSYIEIILQNSSARGYKVNEILFSDMSNTDFLMQRLYPMIRDYEEDRKWWDKNGF